jgi:uncharacterized membrane protein YcaP (DUF421 family)
MTRRAIGQLSVVEVLLIVALGSAVGDPMFYPDVPLLHGMAVISTVVLLNQAFAALVTRSERMEVLLEGKTSRVVHEGRIDLEGIHKTGLDYRNCSSSCALTRSHISGRCARRTSSRTAR